MADTQTTTLIRLFPLFFMLSCTGIILAPAMAAGNDIDSLIPTYHLLLFSKISKQKIFIIGASTVRYDNNIPGDIGQNHSQYPVRIGWGSALYNYMRTPANIFNQARRGATSVSYRQEPPPADHPDYKGPGWWGGTRALIESVDTGDGGFLFIQFGGNDNIQHISETDFKTNLRFYRDQAFELALTPVFITPVDSRSQGDNRGAYPGYMIAVANEPPPPPYQNRKVMLLDLHQRSLDEFGSTPTINLGYRFGNVPYIYTYSGNFQRMDNTHFEQRGAIRVAGWVKDLACELQDQSLCDVFKKNFDLASPTVYFTGEYIDDSNPNDPEINGWYIANPDGSIRTADMGDTAIISKVYNADKSSHVLVFNTYFDATDRLLVHGFHNDTDSRSWANQDQHILSWDSLFFSDNFRIYVEVTTTAGLRHLTYKPLDTDEGSGQIYPQYIRFGLGSDANDGTWKSFRRNLDADLKKFEPNNEIIQINGIRIRGTGRIDNLRMF